MIQELNAASVNVNIVLQPLKNECKKRNLETIAGGTTLGSIPQSIKFGGTSHGNFYYTPNVSDGMSWEYHTC